MKIPILRVRDADGNIVDIPAIVGPPGPKGEPGVGVGNITAGDVTCADGKTVEEHLASMAEAVEAHSEATEGLQGLLSVAANGTVMLAENAYLDKDATIYHYKADTVGVGARGIVFNPGGGVQWFDTGTISTTKDAAFAPELMYLSQQASVPLTQDKDLNNLVVTGIYNGTEFINAPNNGTGWFYIINIGHIYSPSTYRIQIALDFEGIAAYWRVCCNGRWFDWKSVIGSSGGKITGALDIYGGLNVIGNAGAMSLVGADHIYIPFYRNGVGSKRSAYLGFGGAGSNIFTIANEDGGPVHIFAAGGVMVNGERLPTIHKSTAAPTAADGVDGDVWHQYV